MPLCFFYCRPSNMSGALSEERVLLAYWGSLPPEYRKKRIDHVESMRHDIIEETLHAFDAYWKAQSSNTDFETFQPAQKLKLVTGYFDVYHKKSKDEEYISRCRRQLRQSAQTNNVLRAAMHKLELSEAATPRTFDTSVHRKSVSVSSRAEPTLREQTYKGLLDFDDAGAWSHLLVYYMPYIVSTLATPDLPTFKDIITRKKSENVRTDFSTSLRRFVALIYTFAALNVSQNALDSAYRDLNNVQEKVTEISGSIGGLDWGSKGIDSLIGMGTSQLGYRDDIIHWSKRYSSWSGLSLFDSIDTGSSLLRDFVEEFPDAKWTINRLQDVIKLPSLQIPLLEGQEQYLLEQKRNMTAARYDAEYYMIICAVVLMYSVGLNAYRFYKLKGAKGKEKEVNEVKEDEVLDTSRKSLTKRVGEKMVSVGLKTGTRFVQSMFLMMMLQAATASATDSLSRAAIASVSRAEMPWPSLTKAHQLRFKN